MREHKKQAEAAAFSIGDMLRGSTPLSDVTPLLLTLFGVRLLGGNGRAGEGREWDQLLSNPQSVRRTLESVAERLLANAMPSGSEVSQVLTRLLDSLEASGDVDRILWKAILALDRLSIPEAEAERREYGHEVAHSLLTRFTARGARLHTSEQRLNELVARIATHRVAADAPSVSVYDPTLGAAGTVAAVVRHLKSRIPDTTVEVFGQEPSVEARYVAAWNLLLSGTTTFHIAGGSVLTSPAFLDNTRDELQRFDIVVSAPPIGLKSPDIREAPRADAFGRFVYGASRSFGDLLFLQHALASTAPGGIAAVSISPGALTRSGEEEQIREGLVRAGVISAVILLPGGYIADSATPSAIVLASPDAPGRTAGRLLMVDAQAIDTTTQGGSSNGFATAEAIVSTLERPTPDLSYARPVSLDELAKERYNLSPARYVIPDLRPESLPSIEDVDQSLEAAWLRLQSAKERFTKASSALEEGMRGPEAT